MVRVTSTALIRWMASLLVFSAMIMTNTVSFAGENETTAHSNDWSVSFSPREDAKDVPVDSVVRVTFQKAIKLSNKKEITHASIEKIIKLTNSKNRKVTFTGKWEAASRTITIQPIGNLENDTLYTVSLLENKLIDQYGRKNPEIKGQFLTKKQHDHIPPTATITPANGARNVKLDEKIIVQFAENVVLADGTSLSSKVIANLVQLTNEKGLSVAHTATWNKSKRTITMKVKGKMLKNTSYTVYLPANRVKDEAGNGNQAYSASFITRSK